MKGMIIRENGEPSVFQAADIPVPRIGPNQVLVRVAATSVNPVDWKIRKLAPPLGPDMPAVLHGDVAGVVEAVGADVVGLAVGEEAPIAHKWYAATLPVHPLVARPRAKDMLGR